MKKQRLISLLLNIFSILATIGTIYLVFIYPKQLEIWTHYGTELKGYQQFLATISDIGKNLGIVIFPFLFTLFTCSAVWFIIVNKKLKKC